MKIIHVAFILSAIFGIAAGRIGDTPTVALEARTLKGTSFGGKQASAVATPIGSGANLQAIDLGAIFWGSRPWVGSCHAHR
jgi:hypothetical protein